MMQNTLPFACHVVPYFDKKGIRVDGGDLMVMDQNMPDNFKQ